MPLKRDPRKSIRNKEIKALTEKINEQLPSVLELTGYPSMASINGVYGGKYAIYIDIKNEVIDTPEQFISLYFQGFQRQLESLGALAKPGDYIYDAFLKIKEHEEVRSWILLFLKRTFLRNYEALSKIRPSVEESIVWIGQENASYGLLVTLRFKDGQWENDKSEIRHFKHQYWGIA